MSKTESIIDKIENLDECKILEFDFRPCFKLMRDMEGAMRTFVDRVENGEVRSKKTYSQFKEILGI